MVAGARKQCGGRGCQGTFTPTSQHMDSFKSINQANSHSDYLFMYLSTDLPQELLLHLSHFLCIYIMCNSTGYEPINTTKSLQHCTAVNGVCKCMCALVARRLAISTASDAASAAEEQHA
jgi:hypothetical protein